MDKIIRLLFIAQDLGQGGAERVLSNLLNNLDYSRYKVDLLLEITHEAVYLEKLPKNVSVFNVSDIFRMAKIYRKLCVISYKKHCYPFLLFIRSLFIKQSRYNKLGQYDGVISFIEGSPVFIHSFWQKNEDTFHISWIHCDPLSGHRYAFPSLYEIFYRRMDRIICVTEATKNSFLNIYDIPQESLDVIYNPIDKKNILQESNAFTVDKKKFTIGFVGRLYKRADRLVRVARLFKDACYDLEFWFLGGSSDLTKLSQLSQELNVEDRCVFYGFMKNPYPYMKAMDIYISTSDAEACSTTIIEACCLGRPVVSTPTRGSSELLGNGKYGILTEFDDHSIFMALKSLVDDPELRHSFEKKALERSRIFSLSQPLSKITELIEELSVRRTS